jgi:NAD(P)-dependent dehydrogenase (short-subunit alcohol dehydrogenase family)
VLSDLAIREAELGEAVAVLQSQGASAHGVVLDVTDEQEAVAVVTQINRNLGPVSILVNNAGTGIGVAPIMKTTTTVT